MKQTTKRHDDVIWTGTVRDSLTALQHALQEGAEGVIVMIAFKDDKGQRHVGHQVYGHVKCDEMSWIGSVLQHEAMCAAGVGDDCGSEPPPEDEEDEPGA